MSRIALIGENSIEFVSMLIDIWNHEDCAVIIDWRIPLETACKMMQEAEVVKCYIESRLVATNIVEKCPDIEFVLYQNTTVRATVLPETLYHKFHKSYSNKEAVCIYSSGTTGASKGIILSYFAINTNADAIQDYMNLQSGDCLYLAKSLTHSSTLIGELLVALRMHVKLIIAPTIVPPRYVLDNIIRFEVTTLCLNPTLLQMFMQEYMQKTYYLPSLKNIYVSGSILNDSLYRLVHQKIKNINIYNLYGLSEAGPRVTAQCKEYCHNNSVGRPILGVEIALVDDCGIVVKNNMSGIIHVKTPSRYKKYISGSEKHKSLYKGWLNTGDIGYLDEYGELHIVGRCDDVIILNSHKIYPAEVEKQINQILEIEECVVLQTSLQEADVLVCLYSDGEICKAEARKKLSKVLIGFEIPALFVKCDKIPRTHTGKILRNKAREMLENILKNEKETH